MARINIEEKLFSDLRWMKLVLKAGCQHKALGLLTGAWVLAQKNWLQYGCIPEKAWDSDFDILIEVQLASRRADGSVYIKGSKKAFLWLEQKQLAGKKGGEAKAENAKNVDNSPSESLAGASVCQTEASGVYPLTPTLTLTPIPTLLSSSNSSSISSSKNTEREISKKAKQSKSANDELRIKANAFIAMYCEMFKFRWQINPPINGKESGIAKRLAKELSEEKARTLLSAYFQMPDAGVVKAKHPLNLFELKMNEVAVFANSGHFTTRREATQMDDMATNAILLKEVREGRA